jgi:peptidoglycan/xylan/chitin deacetylase (PgdA/CDA1 family)
LVEAVEAMARGDVPDNAVVITFDDGYRDNFDLVYPILTALSLEATIFLATGVIGTDRLLWHDRVFRAFNETKKPVLREFIPEVEIVSLEDPAHKEAGLNRILGYLRSLGPEHRDKHIDELEDKLGVEESESPTRLMLSWEEVRQMQQSGVSFGAHTVTHPILTRISTDRAEWEIVESKRELEERLQSEVKAFAYPNGRQGDFDTSTKEILKEAGFTCAVTTMFGPNPADDHGRRWDRLELHRGGPNEADPALFAAKMNVFKFLT